jgi:hypothetical protein
MRGKRVFTLGSDDGGYGGSPDIGTFTIDGARKKACPYGKVKSGPRKGRCRKRPKAHRRSTAAARSAGRGRVVKTYSSTRGTRCRARNGHFKKCP